jgi:hypothetical protein
MRDDLGGCLRALHAALALPDRFVIPKPNAAEESVCATETGPIRSHVHAATPSRPNALKKES